MGESIVKNKIRERLNEKFKEFPKDEYTLKLKRMMLKRLTQQYELAIKGGGDEETVWQNIEGSIENYSDVLQMMNEAELALYEKEGKTSHKILKTVFRSIFLWIVLFSLYFFLSMTFDIWTFSWLIFLLGIVCQCYIIFRLFTPKL